MATPEQSRPPRTGPEPDSLARSVPEPSRAPVGSEPEENRPGHHPPEEQDQPPLDDFAAKFGIPPESPSDEGGAPSPESPSQRTGREAESPEASGTDEAGSDDGPGRDGGRLPRPVRTVWVVAARRGVLPALGGLRSATDALERIVRRTI